jgi:hypothetical protein
MPQRTIAFPKRRPVETLHRRVILCDRTTGASDFIGRRCRFPEES